MLEVMGDGAREDAARGDGGDDAAAVRAELQEVVYAISHDLTEPLRMVTSFLGLLERRLGDDLDERSREYVHYAVDGALRMKALLDDLLRFSRAHSVALQPTPIDLDALAPSLDRVRVDGPLGSVTADRPALLEVLGELVANAWRFGATEVALSATRVDATVRLAVSDDGEGMEPRMHERALKLFGRLHARDEVPGSGVGLPLVLRLLQRHGGRLELDSAPGQGSTLTVVLPDAGGRA